MSASFLAGCGADVTPPLREPLIVVNTDLLDFGEVPVGESRVRTLTITNPGAVQLRLSSVRIVPLQGGFTSPTAGEGLALDVPFDRDLAVDVSFSPIDARPHVATIAIRSNAGNVPEKVIDLRGVGTRTSTRPLDPMNRPPTAQTVTIRPETPRERDRVTAEVGGAFDPDGDRITYHYEWQVGGTVVSTTATLTGADFDKGDVITVVVTPDDGAATGDPVPSPPVTAANTPPMFASARISPSVVYAGTDLSAAAMGWADPDPADVPAEVYEWRINNALVPGQTAAMLSGAGLSRGDVVEVSIYPDDGEAQGAPVTDRVTVQNQAPGAPTVMIRPAMPTAADELRCVVTSSAADPDGDPLTYAFRWERDGAPSGVLGSTVAAALTTAGERWACVVKADDGLATGPDAADMVTIAAAPTPMNKKVFKSSQRFAGDFGTVTGADAACQRLAMQAGLQGTFKAWLSGATLDSSPSRRFTRSAVPYVLVDGTLVANDWADLTDGTIANPISMDETGGNGGHPSLVYSFTRVDGTPGLFTRADSRCYGADCHCNNWTNASASTPNGSGVGRPNYATAQWTDYSFGNFCGGSFSIYCFEQ